MGILINWLWFYYFALQQNGRIIVLKKGSSIIFWLSFYVCVCVCVCYVAIIMNEKWSGCVLANAVSTSLAQERLCTDTIDLLFFSNATVEDKT